MISRLSQMWLPLVMTSTPASYRLRAVEMVRPMPPARFSPLAVTKSMPRVFAQRRQRLFQRHAPGLADDVADHQHAQGVPTGSFRDQRQQVRGERPGDGPPIVRGGYFAYSTARVSRMTVTLIWPG